MEKKKKRVIEVVGVRARDMSTKEEKLKAKTLITTKLPYPKNPTKKDKERQFAYFLNIFERLHINLPFLEAFE